MTTLFVTCFIAGLGLSVVSFVSGMDEGITLFEDVFHGSRVARARGIPREKSARINAAAITAFLMWFGGAGLLLERLSWPAIVVAAAASGIGFAGGALVNSVIHALSRRESAAESLTMIGVIARTVVPIRAGDGTGEIVFTHGGARHACAARSDDGSGIEKGTEVVVTKYEKGIAYVATWDALAPQTAQADTLSKEGS